MAVADGLCYDHKQKLTTHHSRRDRVGLLPTTVGRHAKKHAPLTASFA
jgi:hypothetical protein